MSIGQGDTLVTPIQMAQAYAALLDGGRVCAARLLRAVQTADGVPVRTLGSHCGRKLPFAASDLAYVRDALAGTVRDGTAAAVFRGFPLNDVWVSGKTGTAQDYVDAWFCGYTPQLATCVWVGYPDAERPLQNIHGFPALYGGTIPALIWHDVMAAAMEGQPVIDFVEPSFDGYTLGADLPVPTPSDMPSEPPFVDPSPGLTPSPTTPPTTPPTPDPGASPSQPPAPGNGNGNGTGNGGSPAPT